MGVDEDDFSFLGATLLGLEEDMYEPPSICIMENNAERVAASGPQGTHPMTKIDSIKSPRALDRPVMNCKSNSVALAKGNYLWFRLHPRALLGQNKFAASKVSRWFR